MGIEFGVGAATRTYKENRANKSCRKKTKEAEELIY